MLEAVDHDRLRALAVDYAHAVDRRDAALLRTVFTPDATLTVRDLAAGTERSRHGVDEIAAIPDALAARYPVTFHVLGQSRYVVPDGDALTATGEVLCDAHHHVGELGAAAVDRVMHIRYLDDYVLTDGGWRIAGRVVEVQFSTEHPVPAAGSMGR